MSRLTILASSAATCLALAGAAAPARAQDTARTQTPGVDSAQMYVGDWDFTVGRRDSSISGVWRINYANGRFTGIVARPGMPVAPISSFTLRNGREFVLTVDFNGEVWTFSGRLENARNITGTLSTHGSIDRLRAQKRAG